MKDPVDRLSTLATRRQTCVLWLYRQDEQEKDETKEEEKKIGGQGGEGGDERRGELTSLSASPRLSGLGGLGLRSVPP